MKKMLLFFSYIFLYNSITQTYFGIISQGLLQACYSAGSTIGTQKIYLALNQELTQKQIQNDTNTQLKKLEKTTYTGSLITDAASWTALWYKTRQFCAGNKKNQAIVLGTGLLSSLGIHSMGKAMISIGTIMHHKVTQFSTK